MSFLKAYLQILLVTICTCSLMLNPFFTYLAFFFLSYKPQCHMFLSLFFVDFKSTLLSSKGEEVESANSLFLFYVFYRSIAHSEVHTFLAYSSVHFYICIHLCKHHTDEDIKHFHYSRRKQLILKSLLEQGEWASKLVGSLL